MLHTKVELEYFHRLLKLSLSFSLTPGFRIGRGFADVGFEEYSVLANNQAISLSTGKVIELDEFYQNYYFPILTTDQITKEIYSRGWNIIEVNFIDQRDWNVSVEKDEQRIVTTDRSLLIGFAKALIEILENVKNVSAEK